MNHGRGEKAESGVAVLFVVSGEELLQKKNEHPELMRSVPENPGRYFKVLNWLSEEGLSFETCQAAVGFDDPQIRHQECDRFRRGSL
jgi:hypothetical protein